MQEETIVLRGEYIKLDQAIKYALGMYGGEAKELIQSGAVLVNGEAETRRGKKLRGGDIVIAEDMKITISE